MNQKILFTFVGIFILASIFTLSFTSGAFSNEAQQKMESKTIRSITEVHPGISEHQFLIVLPSDDKIYDGKITWVSSQPVLPAVLHGPLDSTQINGQFASSIDEGKTTHAITVAAPQLLNGTYSFVGNGLIMHNVDNNTFWISYSVSYKEMKNGDN